jgi:protein FRG1
MILKVPNVFRGHQGLITANFLTAWVQPEAPIEVLGPTFIVHPSDPPRCVAFDSTRDRITLPALASSEPSTSLAPTEVSHVWVITRIAGSATVNLRTATGKFLSCDSHGVVSADREARGPQEEWTPVLLPDTEPPVIAFLNSYDKYLSIDEVAGGALTLRGDSDVVGFNERFFVKVQYEYKKKATEEERKRNLAADLERGGKIDEAATKYASISFIVQSLQRGHFTY